MFEDDTFFHSDNEITSNTIPKKYDSENKPLESSKEIIKKRKLDVTSSSRLHQSPSTIKDVSLSPGFVKRRFPGPAGLLQDTSKINILQHTTSYHESPEQDEDLLLCSQQTYSLFEEGSWKKMTEDFQDSRNERLYEKFNINWIKINSSKNKMLVNHKAPFLAAVLENLDVIYGQIPTINVTLKDKSGKINGTILYSLYEEYSNFMTTNSVLVLKQFGVLSFQNNHCITITPNNLAIIYHIEKTKSSECGQEAVKKVVIQPCSIDEIWDNYTKAVATFEKCNSNFILAETSVNNSKFMQVPVSKVLSISSKPNVMFSYIKSNSTEFLDSSLPTSNTVSRSPRHLDVKSSLQNKCVDQESQNKNEEFSLSCSQVSVKFDKEEHCEIWKNLFEDVNPIALLEDF